jgi:hypothetical protein
MKHDVTAEIQKSEQEWRNRLGPERYRILREAGTEAPFTGKLLQLKDDGTYVCGGCGPGALYRRRKVRFALRLAELHASRGTGERPAAGRLLARHATHRSAL